MSRTGISHFQDRLLWWKRYIEMGKKKKKQTESKLQSLYSEAACLWCDCRASRCQPDGLRKVQMLLQHLKCVICIMQRLNDLSRFMTCSLKRLWQLCKSADEQKKMVDILFSMTLLRRFSHDQNWSHQPESGQLWNMRSCIRIEYFSTCAMFFNFDKVIMTPSIYYRIQIQVWALPFCCHSIYSCSKWFEMLSVSVRLIIFVKM